MRPLKIGRNRQRLQLYDVPESTKDTWGQPSQVSTLIGEFWGYVVPLKGDEMLNVRQVWPTATHTVYMRWLGSMIPKTSDNPQGLIVPHMVIVCVLDQSYLHIVSALNVEKRNWQWKLTCEEKIGASA